MRGARVQADYLQQESARPKVTQNQNIRINPMVSQQVVAEESKQVGLVERSAFESEFQEESKEKKPRKKLSYEEIKLPAANDQGFSNKIYRSDSPESLIQV